VYKAAGKVIQNARKGKGPAFLHITLSRYYGHFEGDAATYRPKDEVEQIRKQRDCLMLFRRQAVAADLVTDAQLDTIEQECIERVDAAVAHAQQAPPPTAGDLLTDVYVSY